MILCVTLPCIYPFYFETHCVLGLVALPSEEVLEVMGDDYPQKYKEYIAVVQEREFQATLRKRTMESKRMALLVRSCFVSTCYVFLVGFLASPKC